MERTIAVGLQCFIKKDGKYLMLHRSKNKKIMPDVWMAPGGKQEFNEGLFACAKREVFEETGLRIKNLRVKVVGNAYLEDVQTEMFFHFLIADYAGGGILEHPKDGELRWLTPEEIGKLDTLLAETREILPVLFVDDGKIISYTAVYKKGNQMTSFLLEK